MLSFECIKNEKSVYFLLTSALCTANGQIHRETYKKSKRGALHGCIGEVYA